MTRRKVLILIKEYLLNAAVQSLLSHREDLQVLAKSVTSDAEMIQVIDAFQPDSLVMDEDMRQQSASALAVSFGVYPALRAIVVHVEDNTIEICDKKTVVIKKLDDFVSAI